MSAERIAGSKEEIPIPRVQSSGLRVYTVSSCLIFVRPAYSSTFYPQVLNEVCGKVFTATINRSATTKVLRSFGQYPSDKLRKLPLVCCFGHIGFDAGALDNIRFNLLVLSGSEDYGYVGP